VKVEVSEKNIVREMHIYFKANRTYPQDIQMALEHGKSFTIAGLTPLYVYDQEADRFIVTSRENIDHELH
jgi:hypothetical protein